MFEQAFKNIDDVLRKEAGCTTELDYTEQTSWLLFLKYLDGLEQDRQDVAKLEGRRYTYLLDKEYRWDTWAAPKTKDGEPDHRSILSGDDLRDFVTQNDDPKGTCRGRSEGGHVVTIGREAHGPGRRTERRGRDVGVESLAPQQRQMSTPARVSQ